MHVLRSISHEHHYMSVAVPYFHILSLNHMSKNDETLQRHIACMIAALFSCGQSGNESATAVYMCVFISHRSSSFSWSCCIVPVFTSCCIIDKQPHPHPVQRGCYFYQYPSKILSKPTERERERESDSSDVENTKNRLK